ncbi:MAG TPA: EamA family transporter [Ureibacillus sp.]|nr:EamA family transporter [Ureibacillus sp.]
MRVRGIIYIIIGSVLWGTTGPMMEWLMDTTTLTKSFILSIRLIISGVLLLSVAKMTKLPVFSIWKSSYWWLRLILFSLFGMLGLQFTFVAAIDASNSVMATLLQFSAPIFIITFVSLKAKKFPPFVQVFGIIGMLFGLFFLLTNGSLSNLVVSAEALIWGFLVGLTFTFYTLFPIRLMDEWGVLTIVGWGMLIAGFILAIVSPIWLSTGWMYFADPKYIGILVILILFGTLAFVLSLGSLKYITAVENSVLSSVEPLTAMIVSILWFGTLLQPLQLIGAILILVFVIWLSLKK